MGKCRYCGGNAGLFRGAHAECERRHADGVEKIRELLLGCFRDKRDFYLARDEMAGVARGAYVSDDDRRRICREVFDEAVERYLDDGVIDAEEERTVARFIQFSELPQAELNANRSLEKVVQSKVLADLLQGRTPAPRITVGGDFPFLLGKNEHLVWLFRDVTLHMQKTRRQTVGRTRGVSVRICKGVYYRTGGFKGTPVETTVMERVGTGSVCLTDRHLYFHSPMKSLKIPLNRILTLDPYSNGVGVQKDGPNDRPMFFENLDSWFCQNAIANLVSLG